MAYGTTTLKLDSGQEIVVPHIIRTSIKLQLVKVYTDHCSLIGYKPLSQSSLLRILEDCKTSQRKALSGIDNYTTDGYEGFEMITKILERLPLLKEDKSVLKSSLRSALVYVKGNYRLHVCKEGLCASHCCTFALSNPKSRDLKESCRHSHSETCHDCQNLFFCLESVTDLIHEHVKEQEELLYEAKVGTCYIFEWMKHIMRGVHSQDSKINALSNLDNESAWLVGDWMMKILPQRCREKMEDWCGKRGISGHVHCFLMPDIEGLKKVTYFTFLDHCSQDIFTKMTLSNSKKITQTSERYTAVMIMLHAMLVLLLSWWNERLQRSWT